MNNLGSYTSMNAVWEAYPYGGIEGDYVTISDQKYYWNKYVGRWTTTLTTETEFPVSAVEGIDVTAAKQKLNNLGTFASLDAAWNKYPEGGKQGDWLTVGEKEYWWNWYNLQWEDTEAPITEAMKTYELDGNLIISGSLSVADRILSATLKKYLSMTDFNTEITKYALKTHTHTKSEISDFPTNVSQFTNDANYATKSYVASLVASAGSGGTVDLTGYATYSVLNTYSWWGRQLSSGSVSGDMTRVGSITMVNGNKSVKLEVDAKGNLKVNGNLYATGGVSALGTADTESGGGTSASLGGLLTALNTLNAPTAEGYLHYTGSGYEWTTPSTGGTGAGGTVTSVGMTMPAGMSVSPSVITSSGTFAVTMASGYMIPTTDQQGQWDAAYCNIHVHDNKTVLDGITSAMVTNWSSVYSWYAGVTGSDTDSVINKWGEIVDFLKNISSSTDLDALLAAKMNTSTWNTFIGTDYYHKHNNKTVLDVISSDLVTNWNTAYSNNHTHSNKAMLDCIDQNLATTGTPTFASLNVGSVYMANNQHLHNRTSGGTNVSTVFMGSDNSLVYGEGTVANSINVYLRGKNVNFQVADGTSTTAQVIAGYFGSDKSLNLNGALNMNNNQFVTGKDTSSNVLNLFGLNDNNYLSIGSGIANSYDSILFGKNVSLSSGNATHNLKLSDAGVLTLDGFGIHYDSTNKALCFDGNIYATGGVSALGLNSNAGSGVVENLTVSNALTATTLTTSGQIVNLSDIIVIDTVNGTKIDGIIKSYDGSGIDIQDSLSVKDDIIYSSSKSISSQFVILKTAFAKSTWAEAMTYIASNLK